MEAHTRGVAAAAEHPPIIWHPKAPDGLSITRVQIDEPRGSQRSGPRVMMAANSHVDFQSDGRGHVDARVSVSQPSATTLRLHLYRADGGKIRTLELPPLTVTESAKWKEWRADFSFPAGEYNDLATIDFDFDDIPSPATV